MPTWTSNIVAIRGDESSIQKVRKQLKGKSDFDFNQLIPMPKRLSIETGSRTDLGRARFDRKRSYPWLAAKNPNVAAPKRLLELRPETVEIERQAAANVRDHQVPAWYGWCNEHWGTKWNACGVKLEAHDAELTYRFDTAYSAPHPIAAELASLCADLGLSIKWTAKDEDDPEAYDVLR